MRKSLWTSLIGLATLSLALNAGVPRLGPVSKPSEPDAQTTALARAQSASNSQNKTEGTENNAAAPRPRDGAPPASVSDPQIATPILDEADRATLRRVLEIAVVDAQSKRPLSIHPDILDAVAADGDVRIIFDVNDSYSADHPGDLERALAGPGGRARLDEFRLFPRLSHGAARVGPTALLELIESGAAAHIELDAIYRPSLVDSLPIISADLAHQGESDGDGRVLAVLDTGIQTDHPMFASRLVEEACFSLLGQCPNDETEMVGPGSAIPCAHSACGHGTHVTGIAVGDFVAEELTGVAPHSRLIAIQIFSIIDDDIGAYSSDILAGLQHVLGLAPFYSIDAVNLSLGGNAYPSEVECDAAVRSQRIAVGRLRNEGIATVAASGNEHLTNAMNTPACLSNVFSVGSTNNNDLVSNFSNSASFLSALAPGQSIESAGLGGSTRFSSGTSMASPHVAGAFAIIREAHPTATVAEIENALVLSGLPVFDTRNGETHPRIDVQGAIDFIAAMTSEPPPEEEVEDESPPDTSDTTAASPAGGGGGGGGCGLVGIEPFLVLGAIRLARRRRLVRGRVGKAAYWA